MYGKFLNFLILVLLLFNMVFFYKVNKRLTHKSFILKSTSIKKSSNMKFNGKDVTAVFNKKSELKEFLKKYFNFDNITLKEILWKNCEVFVTFNIDE